MIDEFSDVNEGEKELMKLWNLHVMRHGFVGDCQLPLACEMFLDAKGHEIVRKNLYRNFILHMCSLFDYGLIAAETVYKTVQKLQGMLSKYGAGQEMMQRQREAQLKYWLEVGMHKKQEDPKTLKSPQKPTLPANAATNSSTSSTSGAATSCSAMQPPKRMPAHLKRSSAASSSGSAQENSTGSGSGTGSNNSKNVAKKSADQPASNMASTRERRSDPGLKRSSSGTRLSDSGQGQGSKRKLSAKGTFRFSHGDHVRAIQSHTHRSHVTAWGSNAVICNLRVV